MSLDDIKHVEAVAIIERLVEWPHKSDAKVVAEAWLRENRPPPSAYIAAMSSLVEKDL